jgi:hypothetical protein
MKQVFAVVNEMVRVGALEDYSVAGATQDGANTRESSQNERELRPRKALSTEGTTAPSAGETSSDRKAGNRGKASRRAAETCAGTRGE